MRIALVHYHLRPGGVTRVMETSLAALRDDGHRFVILSGEKPSAPFETQPEIRVIPSLGYAREGEENSGAEILRSQARSALGGEVDLWHFHNHALGKNAALPLAVRRLADRGERILLGAPPSPQVRKTDPLRRGLKHLLN